MNQKTMLTCEGCANARRVGGAFYRKEPGPQDPEPLIPVKVLVCLHKPGCGHCACGRVTDGKAGELARCEGCGSLVRLEPTRYVNPWESCKIWTPRPA